MSDNTRYQTRAHFAKLILSALAILPLPANHVIGGLIGWLLNWFPSQAKAVTARNIALCFPELDLLAQRRLVRQSLIQGGRTLTEMAVMWLWPADKTLRLIKGVSGQEHLARALQHKTGAFISAPHLGCWEVVGLYCATQATMTNLYRPPKLEPLDALIRQGRQRTGAQVVPTNARGVRALLEAVKRGELVGILPDQDPGKGNGVFAPFFGHAANTMTLLSRLASKSGAPVIFAYAERLPKGQGYHLHFVPTPAMINNPDTTLSTCQLNATLEHCVRTLPTQYQWSYKRFKTRPEGEDELY